MKYIVIILLFGCNVAKTKTISDICFAEQTIENISLTRYEDVRNLDKKIVKLQGIFHYNFEDVALYSGKPVDASKGVWINGFSDVFSKYENELEKMNRKEVIIFGRVNVESKGHYGEYIASIDSVFCIRLK